jgi:hypothetical protein
MYDDQLENDPSNDDRDVTQELDDAPEQPKSNYEETSPVRGPAKPREEDVIPLLTDALCMLMDHPEKVLEAMERIKQEAPKLPGTSEHLADYREVIQRAFSTHPRISTAVTPFGRETALWRQGVEHNGAELKLGAPRFSSGSVLSGDAATMRARAAANLGTQVTVPLWNTGIWVKMRAPSQATLLELERRIAMEKIALGRSTVGIAFSNAAVFIASYLLNVIFAHTYDATLKDISAKNLKATIKVTDIPQLVWGFACTIWTDGYHLRQPCVADPLKCTHIDEGHINLTKMSWTDNRALSAYQKNMMSDRDAESTKEQLDQYHDEHVAPQERTVKINDEVSVVVYVPTIEQYEKAGFRWIDGIVDMADKAFGQSLRGEERNSYITQQGTLTKLRQYAHWIKEIVYSDGKTVDQIEDIESTLEVWSGNKTIRTAVTSAVHDLQRCATVTAIGIPKYTCPACKKDVPEDRLADRLKEIIQVEVMEVFFTLQYMKVMKALASD